MPISKFPTLIALLVIAALVACSNDGGLPEVGTDDEVTPTSCTAKAKWFPHAKTQRPDDAQFGSKTNCEFHQWSWQMFLWLTQDVLNEDGNKEPRFLGLKSPRSLLGMDHQGMIAGQPNATTAESFDEYLQAGTDGILVAHNGRAVYYSQYINKTFEDFIEKNQLTDPARVRAIEPSTMFPIYGKEGTLELKASWMIVEEGDDVSNMFTTTTQVVKLGNRKGRISYDCDQTGKVCNLEKVKVALVGFHIGGVVKGHPEMIWATFEHIGNSPVIPTTPNPFPRGAPVYDQDLTFYTANTTAANCNVNPASSNRRTLDEKTQIMSPITQVCLQYEFGNELPDDTSENARKRKSIITNDKNINSLNVDVRSHLGKHSSDVWANYRQVGAIWFLDGNNLKPNLTLATDELLTGSFKLSNSTIETFTQRATAMDNCFRCHNTEAELPSSPDSALLPLPATNLNISHAFQNIYFWSQQPTR